MSISTLQPSQPFVSQKQKKNFSNIFIYLSAILVAALLIFFGKKGWTYFQTLNAKSAITVDVGNGKAEVFINGELKGVTPYESQDIRPGDNLISLRSSNRQYETKIKFLSNTDKYIHKTGIFRDLGVSDFFSSGQDLWFDENTDGTVLRVISDPTGASVYIDNTEIGKTPFTSSKLSEGDYDLRVEQVGFEPQKTRIRIQKGYASNVSVKLFPMPVPSRVSPFEGSANLYDLSTDNNAVSANPAAWVKGVVYWNQTRGVNLEGVGLNKELVFDYFIDFNGAIYDELGNQIPDIPVFKELKQPQRGAYLGKIADGTGLTEPAKATLKTLDETSAVSDGATPTGSKTATILETGLGWLRVRKEPNTSAEELAKADVGNTYAVLEEQTDWVKIKVNDEITGWVSSQYVEIKGSVE